MKKYEFQVNLNFGKNRMSAYDFQKRKVYYSRTLIGLLREINRIERIPVQYIVFSFQPIS